MLHTKWRPTTCKRQKVEKQQECVTVAYKVETTATCTRRSFDRVARFMGLINKEGNPFNLCALAQTLARTTTAQKIYSSTEGGFVRVIYVSSKQMICLVAADTCER